MPNMSVESVGGGGIWRQLTAPFARPKGPSESSVVAHSVSDGGSLSASAQQALSQPNPTPSAGFKPILQAVKLTEAQKKTPVPMAVLDRAQELLDKGDRGGAYLTLYQELGNEQILIQTQITTYTGIWGSGALTGNNMAREDGGSRYNTQLDEFSVEIAQATIDAVRKDVESGGTGRLSDDQFQSADREVWARKGMAELFPGNIQFLDFWNHKKGDRAAAIFAKSNLNLLSAALRSLVPNTSFLGLNHDLRNVSHYIGKRPAEFAGNPNYTTHGGPGDRFITVVDNRTGFIEAFWDNKPYCGLLPMPQLPNRPMESGSPEHQRRHQLYDVLGANRHASQPSPNGQTLWMEST
jgi:hypothetical protein